MERKNEITINTPWLSRRALLIGSLLWLTLSGCNKALEKWETKQLNKWGRIALKDTIAALQENRLQIILIEVLEKRHIRRGDYTLEKVDGNWMQVYSDDKTIDFTFTEDGYLTNNSSKSLSFWSDLGEVLNVLETSESNNPTSAR